MNAALFINALGFVIHLAIPFFIAALIAGLLTGVFKVVSQIEDPAISFMGKLFGVSLVIYFGGSYFLSQMTAYANRLWGGKDFYY